MNKTAVRQIIEAVKRTWELTAQENELGVFNRFAEVFSADAGNMKEDIAAGSTKASLVATKDGVRGTEKITVVFHGEMTPTVQLAYIMSSCDMVAAKVGVRLSVKTDDCPQRVGNWVSSQLAWLEKKAESAESAAE